MRRNELFPELKLKFDADNNQEYEVETIKDSAVYAKKAEKHLPGLYYLVFRKGYLEEESTWEPSFAVRHLRKMISTFYKDHLKKPATTSPLFYSNPPMTKPSVKSIKLSTKQKQGRLTSSIK